MWNEEMKTRKGRSDGSVGQTPPAKAHGESLIPRTYMMESWTNHCRFPLAPFGAVECARTHTQINKYCNFDMRKQDICSFIPFTNNSFIYYSTET